MTEPDDWSEELLRLRRLWNRIARREGKLVVFTPAPLSERPAFEGEGIAEP